MLRRSAWMLVAYLFCQSIALAEDPLLFSGYVDGSYNYLLRSNQFTSGVPSRLYDLEENGFTLQQVSLLFQKQPRSGFGGVLNIVGGADANILAPQGWNPYFGSQTLAADVPQVYLSFTKDAVTIIGGIFSSLVGSESYLYTLNTNFSHSILDTVAEPGRHVGLEMSVTPNDQLTLTAGMVNGWSTIESPTRLTRLELGVNYKITPKFVFIAQGFSGASGWYNNDDTSTQSVRQLINVIMSYHVIDPLTLRLSVDVASQSKAGLPSGDLGATSWKGMVGYIDYQWTDKWMTSLRGEVFTDPDGYRTGVRQSWKEGTITLGYQVFKSLLFRAETRHDFSNTNAFLTRNLLETSNNQQSYALEALYTF